MPKARQHIRQYSCNFQCPCKERSDVAIAMSIYNKEILKLVQDDKKYFLVPLGRGIKGKGLPHSKKAAFTLAEVLITLGIIGIVAAMTIPTLLTNYRRATVETKLKRFYSTINQALQMSIAEKGIIEPLRGTSGAAGNADYMVQWYEDNIIKYLKTIKEYNNKNDAYWVGFIDGSGFNSYLTGSTLYIFYCLDYRKCVNNVYDGETQFVFSYDQEKRLIAPLYYNSELSLDRLKELCYQEDATQRHACAALIMRNNWKIPDDYHWIK